MQIELFYFKHKNVICMLIRKKNSLSRMNKTFRTLAYLYIILLCVSPLMANDDEYAPKQVKEISPVKYIKTWRVTDAFGSVDSLSVDTAHVNYQFDNAVDRFSIANAFNGNLGSPLQSKIYFDRPAYQEFIFATPYAPYIRTIDNATFYNTKTPYSNINFISGGSNFRKQDNISFIFTANANKKLNFGTDVDFLFARGEYQKQEAKRFAASLFGSYDGERYTAKGIIALNNMTNFENGGLKDPSMISNPSVNVPPINMPVNIDAISNLRHNHLFFNHNYSLGIERKVKANGVELDSTEFVPVTIFSHTLRFDDQRKRYADRGVEKDFYKNVFYSNLLQTNDTAAYQILSNQFSVSMAEEFNKWLRFGLKAYVRNEIERYTTMQFDTTALLHSTFSNVYVGGRMSKKQGELLNYDFGAEIDILGPKSGSFVLDGNLSSGFELFKNKVQLEAKAFMRRRVMSAFHDFYASNHFRWENNFDALFTTHVSAKISMPDQKLWLTGSVENITNYVYFDSLANITQNKGNIQVLAFNLRKDFRLGKFNLENNVVYQLSSDAYALPLPDLALLHNFYYLDKWFKKVLSVQMGASVRYHTAYYAPAYMPAIGQFHSQEKTMIGNYPIVNVYANFHLKQTRFYLEYYHLNSLFAKGASFSMPNYAYNPGIVRIGISWNFYN